MKVSVDVNHRAALWAPDGGTRPAQAGARADIVFAGDDEAALVLGRERADDPEELAAALTGLGPAGAVVKLGAEGASALVDGVHHRQAAVPVQVVDPVGAGDAFVGAYLSELMAGADVKRCLETAALAGALLCTVPGDWEAMPTRAVLDGWTGVDATFNGDPGRDQRHFLPLRRRRTRPPPPGPRPRVPSVP